MGSTSEVVPTYIGHDNTILAQSVQVQISVHADETYLTDLQTTVNMISPSSSSLLNGDLDGQDDSKKGNGDDSRKGNGDDGDDETPITTLTPTIGNPISNDETPITTMSSTSSSMDSSTTSFPSISSLPTQTKSQSPSSYLSTQSKGVIVVTEIPAATEASSAQGNALSGSTIAGIVGGIVGAMILGAFGTFIFMRRIKKRSSSRSSQHTSEKSRPADQPHVRTSINALPELDEQRNPSEMPPNKPMAWELQGSNNFTIWELPA
ncbi:hypothetical protein F4821DRAFT_261010 [Hypoxylon rubiginosum]|uniref:Uncharacterized protein n=1 Tax=Hypoxylon rubiginosum TaxID=110542 RepID=A0ACC0CY09_9PEZI|nr:hypothetical protein F4821DRAFT_261010 [Hypoxylon rubiginosum]